MVLHPSRPKSEQVHLNSPPQFNLAFKSKTNDQDPGTTQHRGQFRPNLNNVYDVHIGNTYIRYDLNIGKNIQI